MTGRKGEFQADPLAAEYAGRLLEMILERGNTLPRTYGFEYEFLPSRMLTPDDMERLRAFLEERGYELRDGMHARDERRVVFEPGGQIEYLSPPMRAFEDDVLERVLEWISRMNRDIRKETGIEYVGVDSIPGRYDAPLLLTSPRYASMHERFKKVGRRGPDMMKGTAAIHMHAAITSEEDIQLLFHEFVRMTRTRLLGMSRRRKEIWADTDPCRSGLPDLERCRDVLSILGCIVEHALDAVELLSGEVYRTLSGRDFNDFLDHLTTIFTDIRVNVKGGTLELRTPDSRPLEEFRAAWSKFVGRCEGI